MRVWRAPVLCFLVAACSSDGTGPRPGDPPDVPASISSTSLDRAILLAWDDNSFISDPGNFQNYRVYSTSYDIDADPPLCGTDWRLEGTTVAPEFLVGALTNGIPRCFSVSAVSIEGAESNRSATRGDTPRPDSRNQVIYAAQIHADSSGFRFWDDDGDGVVEDVELGRVRPETADIDFVVERDPDGTFFLVPVRIGTGVEFYSTDPVGDLTSVDFAPCLPGPTPDSCEAYPTSPIQASPGLGYVFELIDSGGRLRFGAVRVTHVGQTFLILDWAFQTDPGNPELLVSRKSPDGLSSFK
jgi:hypothetical protein